MKAQALRHLPAVMSKNEFVKLMDKSEGYVRLALHRMVQQGLLRPAGPRSSVYYNLMADPNWEKHVPAAARRRYPSATVAGPSVLHAHGLQTQIPGQLWLAVLKQPSRVKMDGVVFLERPAAWFAQFRPEGELFGLPALSPRQALEDAALHLGQPGEWTPDWDDIELDEIEGFSPPPPSRALRR